MQGNEPLAKPVSGNCLLRFGPFPRWNFSPWNRHAPHSIPKIASRDCHLSTQSFARGSGNAGFTLLEVMVALAIAATALVVLMSRLGSSADIQYSLKANALAMETAMDVLARERMKPGLPKSGESGEVHVLGQLLTWKTRVETTPVKKFIRQNVTVSTKGEPDVHLFLYRTAP